MGNMETKDLELFLEKTRRPLMANLTKSRMIKWVMKSEDAKPGFLAAFNKLHINPYWTLEDVGSELGFTREMARLNFNKLYGFGLRDKEFMGWRKSLKLPDESCFINDPRHKVANYKKGSWAFSGAMAELAVLNKSKELGLSIDFPETRTIDLTINGYSVDVKGTADSFRMNVGSISKHYRFTFSLKQFNECDFLVCTPAPFEVFYVVPKSAFPKPGGKQKIGTIYIRESEKNYRQDGAFGKGKYFKYKEAWDQLVVP